MATNSPVLVALREWCIILFHYVIQVSSLVGGRLSEYFEDPLIFDPTRFDPSRER